MKPTQSPSDQLNAMNRPLDYSSGQGKPQPRQVRDYRPETASLLSALVAAGFTFYSYDDGGDIDQPADSLTIDQLTEALTAVDESILFVNVPNGPKKVWLQLVFGNSPGELVADYLCLPQLDAVCSAESAKWEGKPQPMIDG